MEKIFFALIALVLVFLFISTLPEDDVFIHEEASDIKPVNAYSHQENLPEIIITNYEIADDIEVFPEQTITKTDEACRKISELISCGVSFDVKPHSEHFESIYELYEEDLPTNIIDDGRKKIKDIKVDTFKKPIYFGKEPVIAIVIDDMGISQKRTKDINSLHAPITSSFLTYAKSLNSQINDSKAAGHEIIVHVPMEAKVKKDVAPDVLGIDMDKEQIQKALNKMLSKFNGVKGINNHMGSKFTEDEQRMEYVMEVLNEKDMFFLDSKTSGKSKGRESANKYDVKYAARNVFLDNNNDYDYIMGQLKIAERLARKNGYAIAIGHPKSQTYLALKDWLDTLDAKGIKLIHLSEIVEALNH